MRHIRRRGMNPFGIIWKVRRFSVHVQATIPGIGERLFIDPTM